MDFFQEILPKMKRIATDAIRATFQKINPAKKQAGFELFGLDFMIDQKKQVYLIEMNVNPCLEESCPLLGRLIPQMVDNALR